MSLNSQQPFPIEIFPASLQNFLNKTNETLNFPIDFLGAGLLFVTSLLIGNTHKLKAKNGWIESPILYLALVGRPGVNKSHPISFLLKPVLDREKELEKKYYEQKQEYEQLSEQEKASQPEPIFKQLLVNDITPEAMCHVHSNNPHGIGLYKDELSSWIKDFNRYRKGSDEQFWLSAYSNKPIKINRMNKPIIHINSPFIPVIGTIQPKVLKVLFSEDRGNNGFVERMQFVFPPILQKPKWAEGELDSQLIQEYSNVMSRFFEIELETDSNGQEIPYLLSLRQDARELFIQWFNHNVDDTNNPETNQEFTAYISKTDSLCLRLSVIIQALNDVSKKVYINDISYESMEGAIKLTEYFKSMFSTVYTYQKFSKLESNHPERSNFYNSLPGQFNRRTADKVAEGLSINLKTAEKYLEHFVNHELLFKQRQNDYRKTKK